MNRKLAAHLQDMQTHVGHVAVFLERWTPQGETLITGKVLRVTLREDIEAVAFWIEGETFPRQLFSDQIRDCSCRNPKIGA